METVMASMYNMRSAASEEYYDDNATSFSQNIPPLVGKFSIEKMANIFAALAWVHLI